MRILILIASSLMMANVAAACRHSKDISQVFPASEFTAVQMNALAGRLDVEASSSDDITIDIRACSDEIEYLDRMSLDVEDGTDTIASNAVDGDAVPTRHFGVVLDRVDWDSLATRLREAQISFLIEPRIRFQGEIGEQATMFFLDPSGNALEFKSFADPTQLFAN